MNSSNVRVVTKEEGISFAKENQVDFVEISAKTGDNINEMFAEISKTLCTEIVPKEQIDLINFDSRFFSFPYDF